MFSKANGPQSNFFYLFKSHRFVNIKQFLQKGIKTTTAGTDEKSKARQTYMWILMSLLPIGLGIVKIYFHVISKYRLGVLDYLVAIGAIVGGLLLFAWRHSKVLLAISGFFFAVEVVKAAGDYWDPFDFFLTAIAILFLVVPFLRFRREHMQNLKNTNPKEAKNKNTTTTQQPHQKCYLKLSEMAQVRQSTSRRV